MFIYVVKHACRLACQIINIMTRHHVTMTFENYSKLLSFFLLPFIASPLGAFSKSTLNSFCFCAVLCSTHRMQPFTVRPAVFRTELCKVVSYTMFRWTVFAVAFLIFPLQEMLAYKKELISQAGEEIFSSRSSELVTETSSSENTQHLLALFAINCLISSYLSSSDVDCTFGPKLLSIHVGLYCSANAKSPS